MPPLLKGIDVCEKIKFVETSFRLEDISYDGIKLWPFLRSSIYSYYYYSGDDFLKNNIQKPFTVFEKIRLAVVAFYETSFSLFFYRNADFLLTSCGDRCAPKHLDGKRVHRIVQCLVQTEKVIPVDKANGDVVPVFKKYIHPVVFEILARLFCTSKFCPSLLEGKDILVQVLNALNLPEDCLNLTEFCILLQRRIKFYRKLFKFLNTKRLFIICYYSWEKMFAIYAAKTLGIPTIEFQHGTVYKHLAYYCAKKIVPNCYPDYFLAYGKAWKEFLKDSIFDYEKILPIGNYYMDVLKDRGDINSRLFKEKYSGIKGKIVITVASQIDIDREILSYCEMLAESMPNAIFLFKPREPEPYYKDIKNSRIIVEYDFDVYQCIQNSAVTLAVGSTCAAESIFLGVPVLLVNIKGMAQRNAELLGKNDSYRIVPDYDVSAAVRAVEELVSIDRNTVEDRGKHFFAENHKALLAKALESVGKMH